MRNNLIKILAVLAFITLAATSSFAQTATATAGATIIAPIAISQTANMNFGNLIPSGVAGTVTLATDGSVLAAGGVTAAPGIVTTAAAFHVTGSGTLSFSIAVSPASVPVKKDGGGGTDMTLDTWTTTPDASGNLVGGALDIQVGGKLAVGISQGAGAYTSDPFTVTVNYN
jgi:hypothetical protein